MASLPPEPPTSGSAASRTVLGRGLLYAVGTAAPILSNAAATPFVTRLLTDSEYGVVAIATVVVQVGMILSGAGLAAAITRHGIIEASGVAGARYLVMRGSLLSLPIALVALAAYPLLNAVVGIGNFAAYAFALCASLGFAAIVNTQSYLRVLDRPAPFVLLSLGGALGGPVLGCVLLSLTTRSAQTYLLGLAAGYVLTGLVALAMVRRDGSGQHHRGDLGRALRVGLPTIPHQISLYLVSGVLVLVAGAVYSQAAAGRLQLAVLIGSAPAVLTSSLNNAWAPVVYRTAPEDRAPVLESTSRDIAWLTGAAAGFVAMLAPVLLAVVAPATYEPEAMVPAVAWAAAGTVLSVPYLANIHLVFASGRSQMLAITTPLALYCGTVVAVIGASATLVAIAAGMTATYLALSISAALVARRVSPTRWRESVLVAPVVVGLGLCVAGGLLAPQWVAARVVAGLVLVGLSGVLLLRVVKRT